MDNILFEKRHRVMSNEGVMSLITTQIGTQQVSSHSNNNNNAPKIIEDAKKIVAAKRRRPPMHHNDSQRVRNKPGPKPGQRKNKFIEDENHQASTNVVDSRVPISRKLLKVLIKEHYRIQENTDDQDSISSISIVAKTRPRMTKSSMGSTCTTNMVHHSINLCQEQKVVKKRRGKIQEDPPKGDQNGCTIALCFNLVKYTTLLGSPLTSSDDFMVLKQRRM